MTFIMAMPRYSGKVAAILATGVLTAAVFVLPAKADTDAKAVLAKYTRQTEAEILDQSYRFALDIYVKDPTVTPSSIQPIVDQLVESRLVDAKLATATPLSAYYDNSYIDEIKRSGFFAQLWK